MRKFLIIQTAFIGDVVLATPVIEKLHQYYPGAQIDFLLRKGNEGLLQGHPYLHEVLVWDKQKNKQKNLWRILLTIRQRQYDVVINLQRFAATGLLTALSGARERIGFDKNPFSWTFTRRVKHVISDGIIPRHEVMRNLELVKHFTDAVKVRPVLYPGPHDQEKVASLKTQPYVCIAPTSVWFTKQYPLQKWISFLDRLSPDLQVYLLGGAVDQAACEAIRQQTVHPRVQNLCGQLNFLESAALMRDAKMNYVNDSAPLHFASAMNAPVTAIFCSTVPAFGFGPLSEQSYVVETTLELDCKPCGLHGHRACPKGHFHCGYTITEEQLLQPLT